MATTVVTVSQNQLTVAADNDIIEIAPGVSVYSNNSFALYNNHAGVKLINYGGILSSDNTGFFDISFDSGTSGLILNEASGSISGQGLFIGSNNGLTVINFGSITGTSTIANEAGVIIGIGSAFV